MYSSTRVRSSSGVRIRARLALCLLQLLLDRLAQLGELGQNVERPLGVVRLRQLLELGARLLEPGEQLLCACKRFLGAHVTRSLTMRPRMPFTSLAASSVAYRFASVTASSMATSFGTSSPSSSYSAIRRMFRSIAPSRSAVHPSDAAVMRSSSPGACAATASAVSRANSSTSP